MGNVYIFRRKIGFPLPQGGSAGHVGWAFTLENDNGIYCGSTENLNCQPWHAAGEDNGWWAQTVKDETELLERMRKGKYLDYKVHDCKKCDPALAKRVADNCKNIGYSFSGNNCLDHAFQIAVHYGALDMPLPLDIGYPNGWFSALAWEIHLL